MVCVFVQVPMADATTTAIAVVIIVVLVVTTERLGIVLCWQCGTALVTCCAVASPCGLFGIPCPALGCFSYDSVKVRLVRMSNSNALEWSEVGSVTEEKWISTGECRYVVLCVYKLFGRMLATHLQLWQSCSTELQHRAAAQSCSTELQLSCAAHTIHRSYWQHCTYHAA